MVFAALWGHYYCSLDQNKKAISVVGRLKLPGSQFLLGSVSNTRSPNDSFEGGLSRIQGVQAALTISLPLRISSLVLVLVIMIHGIAAPSDIIPRSPSRMGAYKNALEVWVSKCTTGFTKPCALSTVIESDVKIAKLWEEMRNEVPLDEI